MIVMGLAVASLLWVRILPVPTTPYMAAEGLRLGGISRDWVSIDDLPPTTRLAFLAAEDANFCRHHGVEWGLTWQLFRAGATRGGSTISQQMVKNVWLWQGQSRVARFVRKGVELPLSSLVDFVYPKRRILEVYVNVIEFDTGVFGIEAAARHHYRIGAADLTPIQAARLAAVLPAPKRYQAVPPTRYIESRGRAIAAGARDLGLSGRGDCVLDT